MHSKPESLHLQGFEEHPAVAKEMEMQEPALLGAVGPAVEPREDGRREGFV